MYSSTIWQDEERLGELAMKFRSTQLDADRNNMAAEYCQIVERLIQSGLWREMPAPEDQLPDGQMPREFFEFWSGRAANP